MHEKRNTVTSDIKIQWHPGFYAAAELELSDNQDDLLFQTEHNLSRKPLQIDLLVIKKKKNISIKNKIGAIFRGYNIIEYKSPDDGLTIDDFFKTVGYAYLYKGLGETVNQIPIQELTVSLFRSEQPHGLLYHLEECGCYIEQHAAGIYYVKGLLIPAQIVVTKELKASEHISLKALSRNVPEQELRQFVTYINNLIRPGDKEKADAVLQVSIAANRTCYDEIRRNSIMCEALRELMKEEIEAELKTARTEAVRQGRQQGLQQGLQQGKEETLIQLVLSHAITAAEAARYANLSEDEFMARLKDFSLAGNTSDNI